MLPARSAPACGETRSPLTNAVRQVNSTPTGGVTRPPLDSPVNYFSSVHLFKNLLESHACGTIRTNRKCWPKYLNKKVLTKKAKGHIQIRQDGNLVASGWKDNKAVFLLSTMADPTVDTTVSSKQRYGMIVDIPCPSALPQYNQYVNGVDTADQHRTHSTIST